MAPSSAADPHAGPQSPDGSLADANARLEAALARLEALVEAGPLQSQRFRMDGPAGHGGARSPAGAEARLQSELTAALGRERALQAAASAASETLGLAVSRVREVLEIGGEDEEPEEPELDLGPATTEDSRS